MHFVILYPYDTFTFKTKTLRLVSNEGWIKHLLLLYERKYSLVLVFYDYSWRRILSFSTCTTHPLFKIKALHLVRNEGWVKRLATILTANTALPFGGNL